MAAPLRRVLAFLAVAGLASCSAVYRNHGYVPPPQDLSLLEVGISDRDDVTETIGQPTSMGVLDDRGWYYVQSRFRRYGLGAPEEIDREVVAISFNEAGTISNIESFGLEDGRIVTLSRRVTDDNVQGIGFFRQFFGNVGNLNASELLD